MADKNKRNVRPAAFGGSDAVREYLAPRRPGNVVSTTVSIARPTPRPWFEKLRDGNAPGEKSEAPKATGKHKTR
jgi:hypothetical protein